TSPCTRWRTAASLAVASALVPSLPFYILAPVLPPAHGTGFSYPYYTTWFQIALSIASLTRRGWMLRAKRGIYLILPIEAAPGQPTTPEDPWILANKLFSPCYIGGWSAIEYWGLSEQLFNSTLVITAANIRSKQV